MGVVYKARPISLHRPVALKMIKAGVLADDAELRRFQNEAEAVARLDHVGIVPVYEVGEHDGQRYFSMKLVEGSNLAEQLPTFKANPTAAATLLAETAEAVHHAHMRGILHRDLKPANILIDAEGHPHVTDFGLAKRVESDVEMTQSGAILGTPAYMSPEQATGRRGSITTATDVYGLGAILYALLTGKAPFGGESVFEALDAVRTRPPEPPKKLNPHVPRDLETICLKCLEKDQRRRYASAQALADDLHAWLGSRPITARRVGSAERVWLWCKRKPAVAALAVAVVLAAVGGTAAVIVVQTEANRLLEKKNFDLQLSNTKLDQQRVRAVDRETQAIDAVKRFRDAVANETVLKNNPALDDLRKRLLKEPLAFFRALRDRLQADRDTRPESLARLADACLGLSSLTSEIGDKQDALIAYRESLAIFQKLADANPAVTDSQKNLADSHYNIGRLLSATGKPAEALQAYESALAIRQKLADANPAVTRFQIDLAASHKNIGLLLSDIGKPAEALKACDLDLAIEQKLADVNPSDPALRSNLAGTLHNVARILYLQGRNSEALALYERARSNSEAAVRGDGSVTRYQLFLATHHNAIGNVLTNTGKPAEALKAYESARAIYLKLADANPTVTDFQSLLASTDINIGMLLSETGKPDQALKAYESARAIHQKLADANPTVIDFRFNLALSQDHIGNVLREIGKPAEAMKSFETSLAIFRVLVREHPESPEFASGLGGGLHNAAMIDLDAKRFEQARGRLRQAVEWQRKALASTPANTNYRRFLVNHLTGLIDAARGLGDTKAERELARLRDSDPAMKALDARLSVVLKGEAPKSNTERLELAQRAYDKALHAAARLWDEALETDPKLSEDRRARYRYNASRAASLAAIGQGKDDPPRDDAVKAKLRRQALDWLKAELSAWKRAAETVEPATKGMVAKTLADWKEDADLAAIRDARALAKLPEAARKQWQSLWADVDALLKRARGGKP
jgi:serine/threonine-protein kinase